LKKKKEKTEKKGRDKNPFHGVFAAAGGRKLLLCFKGKNSVM